MRTKARHNPLDARQRSILLDLGRDLDGRGFPDMDETLREFVAEDGAGWRGPGELLLALKRDVWHGFHHVGEEEDRPVYVATERAIDAALTKLDPRANGPRRTRPNRMAPYAAPPDPIQGDDLYSRYLRLARMYRSLGDEPTARSYEKRARALGGGTRLRPNRPTKAGRAKAIVRKTQRKVTTAMRRAARGFETGKVARNDYFSSWRNRDPEDFPDEPWSRDEWERAASNFWEAVSYASHGASGGTQIAALDFDKALWTRERAIVWAKAHGYATDAVEPHRAGIRLVQTRKGIPVGRKAFGGSGITADLIVDRSGASSGSSAPPSYDPDDADLVMNGRRRGSRVRRPRGRRSR